MKKLEMLPVSDESFDECDRRVVIYRDGDPYLCSRKEQGDHLFCMWGNHSRYDFSDDDAECPFEPILDRYGYETGEHRIRKGLYVFSVNLYDHSGLSFSLGGDPANGFDPGGWDTTPGAAYLYVDKERYEKFMGEGKWMKIPYDTSDWGKWKWKRVKKDEFREYLRERAEGEVYEMNLCEQGSVYGYRVEEKRPYKKVFPSGETWDEFEWETTDCCGGYLTEHANDIDFPKEDGLPVFYEDDVYLCGDREKGLGSYEYTVPEFVVTRKTADGKRRYLRKKQTESGVEYDWTEDVGEAMTTSSWFQVQRIAQDAIRKDEYYAYENVVDIDKFRTVK